MSPLTVGLSSPLLLQDSCLVNGAFPGVFITAQAEKNRKPEDVVPCLFERFHLDNEIGIRVDGGVGGWLTVGNVGSRTKSMKKGFAGIWSGRKAEQVWVSLEGDYLEETPSLCSPDCSIVEVPFLEETETNSGNVQRNLSNSNKVFYESNELWSTHKMKVDGQIRVYTNNGGLLYLD